MDRRNALKVAVFGGAAVSVGTPLWAASTSMAEVSRSLAGKLYFTAEHPGRWKGKAKCHVPRVKVETDGTDQLVKIVTAHPMSFEHYIVKHILLDRRLDLLGEQVFDISFDLPQSQFSLSGYRGRLYALSVCNLHDTWISELEV